MNTDKEREAFEKWVKSKGYKDSILLEVAWHGWQARAAQSVKAPDEWISVVKLASDALAYAAFNLDGSRLENLPIGIVESTGAAETALIAERKLRALLSDTPRPQQAATDDVRDALYESAYIAGLKHGFSLGQMDDNAGLQQAIDSRDGYLKPIRKKQKVTLTAPEGVTA